jgi:pimeloyl-ACP methyl ester carboxylesterase
MHRRCAVGAAQRSGCGAQYVAATLEASLRNESHMTRTPATVPIIIALSSLLACCSAPAPDPLQQAACAGPPLRTLEARNQAMEEGYTIHRDYDCIDKASFEAGQAQRLAWEQAQARRVASERVQLADAGSTDFAQARHGFQTRIALHDAQPVALPTPPEDLFVRSDYRNPQNYALKGFVSPDPGDGRRHAAIVWLTGGDSNSLSDFWTPGPDQNDQSVRAFREAGVIMAFPVLRGGNGGAGAREVMYGEVDDVLAAAEQLSRLSYVDPARIYLGGHSTGATLALLTAAMNTRFKAVFAFGPVARIDSYPAALIAVDFTQYDAVEAKLRSPIHWLGSIRQPTFVIEGSAGTSNIDALREICAASRNPQLQCIEVADADHFSVLRPATQAIAAKLVHTGGEDITLRAEELAGR